MLSPDTDLLTEEIPFERMKEIVKKLADAKSDQNIDEALNIYHPECALVTPPFNSVTKGRDIRTALENFFISFPDYSVQINQEAVSGKTMIAWGEINLTLSIERNGHSPNGKRAVLPVFILFEFKDDRVIWESFNFDLGALCQQSGVPLEFFGSGETGEKNK